MGGFDVFLGEENTRNSQLRRYGDEGQGHEMRLAQHSHRDAHMSLNDKRWAVAMDCTPLVLGRGPQEAPDSAGHPGRLPGGSIAWRQTQDLGNTSCLMNCIVRDGRLTPGETAASPNTRSFFHSASPDTRSFIHTECPLCAGSPSRHWGEGHFAKCLPTFECTLKTSSYPDSSKS